ncbi:hypothetical protein AB3N59_06495 [Leptospira sp. WS92.C1]
MAGGYHSRSPEEFRKFLEESRGKSGSSKFSRIRLIFILNLVLVVLVIGMVAKTMSPAAFTVQSSSSKIKIESLTLYVKASGDGKDGFPTFFLFIKNEETSKIVRFPSADWKFKIFLSTQESLSCVESDWVVPERDLKPEKIEFARLRLSDETIESLPPDCKIKAPQGPIERILSRFQSKTGLKLEVKISNKQTEQTLKIDSL